MSAPKRIAPLTDAAEQITTDRMAFYGYTPEQIAAADAVHPGRACTNDCINENGESVHPDRDELDRTAEVVMWVLEHPASGHSLADRVRAKRDHYARLAAAAIDPSVREWLAAFIETLDALLADHRPNREGGA